MSWGDAPDFCEPFAIIYEACGDALGFDNRIDPEDEEKS
jgi:hypothetical protein